MEGLSLQNTKTMLLINHDEAQFGKFQFILNESVRSDGQGHLPAAAGAIQFFSFLSFDTARDQPTRNAEWFQKGLHRLIMLFCQNFSWGHDRCLITTGNG